MKAYVLMKIVPEDRRSVLELMRRNRAVKSVCCTLGPFDGIAIIHAPDLHQLARIVETQIHPLPGVLSTLTCLAADAG